MSAFEKAEYNEIEQAMARQAGYELPVEPVVDLRQEIGRVATVPVLRHLNRVWHSRNWLKGQ